MPAKKVQMKAKPNSNSETKNVDQWVEERSTSPESPPAKPQMKRLTLDIEESLHRAIKLRATELGIPMADLLRSLLEKHYR